MTSVSKDYHREACKCRHYALPFEPVYDTLLIECVSSGKVVDNKNDQVSDRDQCNNGGVL